MVFRNWEEANGRPMAIQTKLNAGSESGYRQGCWGFLREFFPTFADLVERYKGDAIEGAELWRRPCLLANAFGVLSRIFLGPRLRVRILASTRGAKTVKAFAAGANAFPIQLASVLDAGDCFDPTFRAYSRPLSPQVCSLQAGRSLFGFARPASSPLPRDA